MARRMSDLARRITSSAHLFPVVAFAFALAFTALPADGGNLNTAALPSASFPPGNPAHGEALARTCAACHGSAEIKVGNPPIEPPKLLHERASYVFNALIEFRSGKRTNDVMGPMAAPLNDQDMRDIAAYLAAKPLGPPHAKMVGTPAYKFTVANCTLCHGETGMGEMQGMPILTGQNKAYLKQALEEFKSGVRTNPTMQAVAKVLSPKEIDEVATYYSSQEALETLP